VIFILGVAPSKFVLCTRQWTPCLTGCISFYVLHALVIYYTEYIVTQVTVLLFKVTVIVIIGNNTTVIWMFTVDAVNFISSAAVVPMVLLVGTQPNLAKLQKRRPLIKI